MRSWPRLGAVKLTCMLRGAISSGGTCQSAPLNLMGGGEAAALVVDDGPVDQQLHEVWGRSAYEEAVARRSECEVELLSLWKNCRDGPGYFGPRKWNKNGISP